MHLAGNTAAGWYGVFIFTAAHAQASAAIYTTTTRPSTDGIGKSYRCREIADVMGWQGASWLERSERQQEERGDLPDASIDLAIMVDVHHELEFPFEVIESLIRALKPGGRIAYVEYRLEDPRVPIKPLHKMSEAQVRKEAAAHALTYERTATTLPWQHVVIFRKK